MTPQSSKSAGPLSQACYFYLNQRTNLSLLPIECIIIKFGLGLVRTEL